MLNKLAVIATKDIKEAFSRWKPQNGKQVKLMMLSSGKFQKINVKSPSKAHLDLVRSAGEYKRQLVADRKVPLLNLEGKTNKISLPSMIPSSDKISLIKNIVKRLDSVGR